MFYIVLKCTLCFVLYLVLCWWTRRGQLIKTVKQPKTVKWQLRKDTTRGKWGIQISKADEDKFCYSCKTFEAMTQIFKAYRQIFEAVRQIFLSSNANIWSSKTNNFKQWIKLWPIVKAERQIFELLIQINVKQSCVWKCLKSYPKKSKRRKFVASKE